MKILAAMLMMGTAVGAWGQSPATSDLLHTRTEATMKIANCSKVLPPCPDTLRETCVCEQPLKCPRYQHDEEVPGCSWGDTKGHSGQCHRCAPDMHVLTEREWQEVITHLKLIEKRQQIDGWPKP